MDRRFMGESKVVPVVIMGPEAAANISKVPDDPDEAFKTMVELDDAMTTDSREHLGLVARVNAMIEEGKGE